MKVGDVATLVSGYEKGLYTFQELVAKLVDWSDAHSLEHLAAELPDALRDELREVRRRP